MSTNELTELALLPGKMDLGPAMRALTKLQRNFVFALFTLGTDNYSEAARVAGYHDNGKSAIWVTAHELRHNPKVQAAIDEESRRRLKAGQPLAVMQLIKIANSPEHKEQLKAINGILNRTGLHEVAERNVNITITREEQLERIREAADKLGVNPEDLFKGAIVEGEFEDVTDQGALPAPDDFDLSEF